MRLRATIWWLLLETGRLCECWSDLQVHQIIQAGFSKRLRVEGGWGGGWWWSRLVDPWETPYLALCWPLPSLITAHCCACPIETRVNEPAVEQLSVPRPNEDVPTRNRPDTPSETSVSAFYFPPLPQWSYSVSDSQVYILYIMNYGIIIIISLDLQSELDFIHLHIFLTSFHPSSRPDVQRWIFLNLSRWLQKYVKIKNKKRPPKCGTKKPPTMELIVAGSLLLHGNLNTIFTFTLICF